MYLTLGIIIGLCVAILIMVTLIYFKKDVVQQLTKFENRVEKKGEGMIFVPKSEIEKARENIIKKNKKLGRDTPISELYENPNN